MQIESSHRSPADVFQPGAAGEPTGGDGAPKFPHPSEMERSFQGTSEREWCELIRDVIALANSGGGWIQIVQTNPAETPLSAGDIVRRIAEYTDSAFADVDVRPKHRAGGPATAIRVGAAILPLGFTRSATAAAREDPHAAEPLFSAGSFYFRHGERSEPGNTADLKAFFERLIRRVRRRWMRGFRRVLGKPIESLIQPKPKRTAGLRRDVTPANLQPVRIVTDPSAPALQPQDVDRLYPWRQKDLVQELNRRIGRRALNSYDIQAVRRHHRLDERPDFLFHLPGAGRRYSPAVMEWVMDEYGRDPEFFQKARAADREKLKLRRQKPR